MTTIPKELTRARFGRVAEKYRKSADHADVEDLDLLFSGLEQGWGTGFAIRDREHERRRQDGIGIQHQDPEDR